MIYVMEHSYYNIGKVLHVGPTTVQVKELRWKPGGRPAEWDASSIWREPRWDKSRVRLLTHEIEGVLTAIDETQDRHAREREVLNEKHE